MAASVLIVDDEAAARYGMRRALEKEGYRIHEADTLAKASRVLQSEAISVILLDIRLSSESGLDFLPVAVNSPNPPSVIIITAHGSERIAVEAIKKGAFDYLAKPFDVEELRIQVRNAVESHALRAENARLRTELAGSGMGRLIGSSTAMKKVFALIERVAQTEVNVLITGESGTGKEEVAREIHARSRVSAGPFIAVNCAAMPLELIESELFGHEKGAFTGAAGKRIGKFEAANNGTLFLDEIGDMGFETQAKVLRVIEDKRFERLGGNETLVSNARLISATNKPLVSLTEEGRFRQDLYYRLCVVQIELPPLRERKSDIPALVESFINRFSLAYRAAPLKIAKDALEILLEYSWPGNVRQLRNCIERAVVLSENEDITLDVLPQELFVKPLKINRDDDVDNMVIVAFGEDFRDAKREFERKYIELCLDRSAGNITRAAALLGIHRQSLQQKIKELGLTKRFRFSE
ncbi:MAG: sigma-54-dependent transcriptional regulator [Blastocatellia bacterium]